MRTVGVDLDGVLADQITGLLPDIQTEFGIELTYADIVHWRLPVADTDIGAIILAALSANPDYLLGMALHPGGRELLLDLGQRYQVAIITARPKEVEGLTREWLEAHGLHFDELHIAEEARKSLHDVDLLVDDYIGNVREFLGSTSHPAVLVDQPWNRDERSELEGADWSCRLAIAASLEEVGTLVDTLLCGEPTTP
jgi:uncharacterized HAD superfamily protein